MSLSRGNCAERGKLPRATHLVVMARYQGARIEEWISAHIEDWMGLTINREKTQTVRMRAGGSLNFLGFAFRYDRDLLGREKTYLNAMPSKKSVAKAREAIREKTGPKKCFKPAKELVADLNAFLKGWCGYFKYGYPRKAFRDLGHYTRKRMTIHLNRRSQRKYHRPRGMSHYQYLKNLGLFCP